MTTAATPNKARTFATRLVEEDKVVAMVGGSTTGTHDGDDPGVRGSARSPSSRFAGAVEIIDPVRKFVFKTPHTDLMACEKIFEDMKKRNFTKIAMISGTDGFGKSMRDAVHRRWRRPTASRSSPTRPTARATTT